MNKVHSIFLAVAALSAGLASTACGNEDSDLRKPSAADNAFQFNVSLVDDGSNTSSRCGNTSIYTAINTANFNSSVPFFELVIPRRDNDVWGDLPPRWCVNFDNLGWRTGSLKPGLSETSTMFTKDNFVYDPQYWNTSKTDFYAVAGIHTCFLGGGCPRIKDVVYNDYSGKVLEDVITWDFHPLDLLWSFKSETRQPADYNRTVDLKFAHAMAKITFSVQNNNSNLEVTIRDIYLGNVYRKGTFRINNAIDLTNYNMDNAGWIDTEADTHAVWTNLSFKSKLWVREENSKLEPLTLNNNTEQALKNAAKKDFYMLVIPQTHGRWDNNNWYHRNVEKTNTEWNDMSRNNDYPAYLIVDCVIKDKRSGLILWETTKTNEVVNGIILPVTAGNNSITWLPGRQYRYRLVFGDGAGWDNDGNPVLVPIQLEAIVRPFSEETKYIDVE